MSSVERSVRRRRTKEWRADLGRSWQLRLARRAERHCYRDLRLTPGRKYLKFQTLDKESVGQPVIFRARLHNMRPQGELLSSRAWYELTLRCQDRLPDLPTASPHSPGCPCRLGREGRAPGVQADAEVCPDHPGELGSIIQVITANR